MTTGIALIISPPAASTSFLRAEPATPQPAKETRKALAPDSIQSGKVAMFP